VYRSSSEYLERAKAHMELARTASDADRRLLHVELARGYRALAVLARKNEVTDLVYETPPASEPSGPVVQQQQQVQRKKQD
jgi:hypothetical protein